MDTTQKSNQPATQDSNAATLDTKLEVIVLPVADVDRAKRFYANLGWRLDADFASGDSRVVQFTPPGSQTSVHIGKGITTAVPGSVQGLWLIVEDIDAARAQLIERGADVSEPFHYEGIRGPRVPGADPERRSYRSYAAFTDPDGNGWILQEIKTRLPGRGLSVDVESVAELLRETEKHHGPYEATAPKHHWSDWYAAYLVARQRGKTSEDAEKEAALHMQDVLR
jgi:catechol 2,3-dioxygenase-like lactoylglutathione lyase family enzyme